jgi:hypothetical protein
MHGCFLLEHGEVYPEGVYQLRFAKKPVPLTRRRDRRTVPADVYLLPNEHERNEL